MSLHVHAIRLDDWGKTDHRVSASALTADGPTTWIEADISTGETTDVEDVARRLNLEEMAVEDALNPRQRPKLDTYEQHLFGVQYQLDEVDEQLHPRQIACFVGDAFVLVLHAGAERLVGEAKKRLRAIPSLERTALRAFATLIDTVVDDYEAIAHRLDRDVDHLEAQALEVSRREDYASSRSGRDLPNQSRLYIIKQQVSMLRRYGLPIKTLLGDLTDHSDGSGSDREHWNAKHDPGTSLLLRDVHDHLIRIAAQVQSIDDLTQAVIDLSSSIQADQLSEINKKLSAWAAIIALPTLIASLYGVNYRLLPRAAMGTWAFVYVLGLMTVTAIGLYVYYKRKDWL